MRLILPAHQILRVVETNSGIHLVIGVSKAKYEGLADRGRAAESFAR
jgi:hypothetical protein